MYHYLLYHMYTACTKKATFLKGGDGTTVYNIDR
jgi:hypothetical protein